MAAGWCVYAIDLIGFGASDQPGLRLDNRLWARQCAAFLAQVVGRPAVLVGNSLGGLVAVTTAVLAPVWVRAVAVAPLPDPTLLMPIPRRRPPGGAGCGVPWRSCSAPPCLWSCCCP
ncbi:alpha/beta fold hydrolase [Cyanobium sp. ATX-6F1]|uniref:alpha/beta fold hydrolase n=1 Tax=Cyanobium sp. ATX-6F1 TaxID=3137388 RepID=UPI0039BDBD82